MLGLSKVADYQMQSKMIKGFTEFDLPDFLDLLLK